MEADMKVVNQYSVMLEVRLFVNGKPGPVRLVMPNVSEEVPGPAFMKDQAGGDIYLSVPGQVCFSETVHRPEECILQVRSDRVTAFSWLGPGGEQYRILAKDFRLDTSVRPSR